MDPRNNDAPHLHCPTCSTLSDQEYAYQKYGSEDGNSFLPAAADRLAIIRDLQPWGSRSLQLRQCQQCGTYYLYRTDYEYLVNGSEDEQFLTRLAADQAREYLDRPPAA